jgi:hypothetical protein
VLGKIAVLLFSCIILLISCNTTEPPPNDSSITLSLDDVSLTEIWINLTTNNLQLPVDLTLTQNDQTRETINLVSSDTILYIDSLLLNTTYNFQAFSIQPPVSSNKLQVTTLDTTSHNFTWQSWTFGEHSSSTLYDIAIIAPDNIWAVGEIYMNDSLGQPDPSAYNAIQWDGGNWNLHRIQFYTICGQTSRTPYPAKAIFAFDENDIWIAMDGDQVARMSGTTQTNTMCLPISFVINKLWGDNSSLIYAVGNGGNIAHYNGATWQSIESGTDVDIHDIWGSVDNGTDEQTILAIASFQNYGRALDLLKIEGTTATKLDTTGLHVNQHSIWFTNNSRIYVVGNGVYYKDNIMTTGWKLDDTQPLIYKERMRGTGSNDIFIVGDFGLVSHFNGATWKHYTGNELPNLLGNYYSVILKSNIMVAAGQLNDGQAIILRGNR